MTAPIAAYIEIINKSNETTNEPEYLTWPQTDPSEMHPDLRLFRDKVNMEALERYNAWLKPKEKVSWIRKIMDKFKKK